jgi:predicted XRE-type DNA-binding protein
MSTEFKDIPEKIPTFKHWLQDQEITQHELSAQTHLSVRTVNKLINTGIATRSTILLVSYVVGVSEDELKDMLVTKANKDYFDNLENLQ